MKMPTSSTSNSRLAPSNCFLCGVGPSIRAIDRMIDYVAPTDIPVLLIGESGTGKDETALEIHYRSQRHNQEFLKFDCRQAPSEGYPAWLSAERVSKIRGATGTIFFDELGQLAASGQERLLQLLTDDGVGAGASRKPRLISASARNLEDEVRDGRLSQELYLTIAGTCLFIPSLRSRPEDIPALLELLLKKHAGLLSRSVPQLNSETMQVLMSYRWPGNVRELDRVAMKIIELGDEQLVHKYLSDRVAPEKSRVLPTAGQKKSQSLKQAVKQAVENVERQLIVAALERHVWNQKRAADELQISPSALREKMLKLGLGTCHSDPPDTSAVKS